MNDVVRSRDGRRTIGAKGINGRVGESIFDRDVINLYRGSDSLMPYQMVFEVCATRIEEGVALEGTIHGDLEGVGRWHFNNEGAVSVVRYEWYVRSTRWWMNLIAPLARSVFIRNHAILMKQGAEGLARSLGSPLLKQENIDLMKAS